MADIVLCYWVYFLIPRKVRLISGSSVSINFVVKPFIIRVLCKPTACQVK